MFRFAKANASADVRSKECYFVVHFNGRRTFRIVVDSAVSADFFELPLFKTSFNEPDPILTRFVKSVTTSGRTEMEYEQ